MVYTFLDAVGFATLNFVSADYKKYAVAYICHSFLLEHISIPFIIVRPQTNLEFPDWQRMKWSLVKQVRLTTLLTITYSLLNKKVMFYCRVFLPHGL